VPKWWRPAAVDLPEDLVHAVESRPLAELLYRRGYSTPDRALAFLTGGVDVDAPGLPDLQEGVTHILDAVLAGREICVYGDYDTDGVTSTALLVDLLRSLNAKVRYHIPNRFKEGYGMNARVVEQLARDRVDLLLTVDCGIKNLDEVALARKLGMKVVVTDHHELGSELPKAEAVINPKRLPPDHPCRMLPGVGTAYLLARQILRSLDRDPGEADHWLDLVTIGVIADVVPLNGANRELARRGLARLHTSPITGLQALMQVAGLEGRVTEEDVAFQLVPRLNAAGRLADASLGVRLLLEPDLWQARNLALELDQLNQERKRLTAHVVESAMAEVREGAPMALLFRSDWHEGVLGIAAGKLAEEYGMPALLMARKQGTSVLVGSARAPEGFALHEALQACSDHLIKFGGHAGAAGFSLMEDQFTAFRAAMLEEARRRYKVATEPPPRKADLALPLAQAGRDLYEGMRRAAPFGEANPEPVLFSQKVRVLSARPIGPGEKHLRLVLKDGDESFMGVWWGGAAAQIKPPLETDMFYRLGMNRYNGEEMLQVIVEHLGPGAEPPPQPVQAEIMVAEEPAPAATVVAVPAVPYPAPAIPELVDRRGFDLAELLEEYPDALLLAEGAGPEGALDRYSLRPGGELVLWSAPPSPRLLDEAVARCGPHRLVLAYPLAADKAEERFLPTLLKLVAETLQDRPLVRVARLAVATGELEVTVRLGLQALAASNLLAIDEEEGDLLRLRRRTDGHGIKESPALQRMRTILSESRAYRRFLRQSSLEAITRAIYSA
jgi:single-stranded-DNA-specific exonuclease